MDKCAGQMAIERRRRRADQQLFARVRAPFHPPRPFTGGSQIIASCNCRCRGRPLFACPSIGSTIGATMLLETIKCNAITLELSTDPAACRVSRWLSFRRRVSGARKTRPTCELHNTRKVVLPAQSSLSENAGYLIAAAEASNSDHLASQSLA